MLNNGDKLVVKKKVASFLDEGDIVTVINANENGMIAFAFGEGFMHKGIMNADECEEHFEKFVEKKAAPTITGEYIAEIMYNSEFDIRTVFDKCTVVSCKLPNGFVITESSACVSPENYDKNMGVNICMGKIEDKIWELEAYRLQQWLWEETLEEDCCCEDCDGCCNECEEGCDECLDTDLDCDDCEDYECPYNSNIRH